MKKYLSIFIAAIVLLPLNVYADPVHNPASPLIYNTNANMRQASTATSIAKSTITDADNANCSVTFDYSTVGKNIFVVYTTDGTSPDKSKTSVVCTFANTTDIYNTWVGTIPLSANTADATIKYVFYISDGDLASGWGRIAADGYKSSGWTEGDSYFSYTVRSANFSDENGARFSTLSELLNYSTDATLLKNFVESSDISLSNSFSLNLDNYSYSGSKSFTIGANKTFTIKGSAGTFDNEIIYGSATSELRFNSAISTGTNFTTKNSSSSGMLTLGDGTMSLAFTLNNTGGVWDKVSKVYVKPNASVTLTSSGSTITAEFSIADGGIVNLSEGTYANTFTSMTTDNSSSAMLAIRTGGVDAVTITGNLSEFYGRVTFADGATLALSPSLTTTVSSRFEVGGSSATGVQTLAITTATTLTTDDGVNAITLDKYGVVDVTSLGADITLTKGNVLLNNADLSSHAPVIKFSASKKLICSAGTITGTDMTVAKNFDFSAVSVGATVAQMSENPSCKGMIVAGEKYVTNTYDYANYYIKLIDPVFYDGTDYYATFGDLVSAGGSSGALQKDCTETDNVSVIGDFALDLNGYTYGGGKTITVFDSKTLQVSGTSGTFDNKISYGGSASFLIVGGGISLGSNFTTTGSSAMGNLGIGDGTVGATISLSNSTGKLAQVNKVYVRANAALTLSASGLSYMPDVEVGDGGIVKLTSGTFINTFISGTASESSTAGIVVGAGASATVTTTGDLSGYYGKVTLYNGSTLTLSPSSVTTVASRFEVGHAEGTSVQTLAVTSVTAFTAATPIALAKYGKFDLSGLTCDVTFSSGNLTITDPTATNAAVIKFSSSHTITWSAGGMAVAGSGGSMTVAKNFDLSSVSAGTTFAITSAPDPCTGFTADGNWLVKNISGESPWSLQLTNPVFTDGTNYYSTLSELANSSSNGTLRKDYTETSGIGLWNDFLLDLNGHTYGGSQTITIGSSKTFAIYGTSGTFDNKVAFADMNARFGVVGGARLGSDFTTTGSVSGQMAIGDGTTTTSMALADSSGKLGKVDKLIVKLSATLTMRTDGTSATPTIDINDGGIVQLPAGTYSNTFTSSTMASTSTARIIIGAGASAIATTTGDLSGYYGRVTFYDGSTLNLSPSSATTVVSRFEIGGESASGTQTLAITSANSLSQESGYTAITLDKYGVLNVTGLTGDLTVSGTGVLLNNASSISNAPLIKFSASKKIVCSDGTISGTGMTVATNFNFVSGTYGITFATTFTNSSCSGPTAGYDGYVSNVPETGYYGMVLSDAVFTDGTNYYSTFGELFSASDYGTLRKDHVETSNYTVSKTFDLNLGGCIYSGSSNFTIASGKSFTVKGSGTFDNAVMFNDGTATFSIGGSVGVGENFTTGSSTSAGILQIGDGTTASSFTMQIAGSVFAEIGSVRVKSNSTVTLSTESATSLPVKIDAGGTAVFSGTGTYNNTVDFADATSMLKLVGTVALGTSFATTSSGPHGTLTIGDGTTMTAFSMANADDKFAEVGNVYVSNSANLTLTTGGTDLKSFTVSDGGTLLLAAGTFANTFTSTTAGSMSTAQIIVGAGTSAAATATGNLSEYYGLVKCYDGSTLTLSPSVSTVASRFVIGGSSSTGMQTLVITSAQLSTGSSDANSITLDRYGVLNLKNLANNLTITNGALQLLNATSPNAPFIQFSATKKLLMTDGANGGIKGDDISAAVNFDFSAFSENTTFAQLALSPTLSTFTTGDGKIVNLMGSGPYDVLLSDPEPAVDVVATTGTTTGTYWNLKKAFDAVNAGTHKGAVQIKITKSHETATAVLNASGSGSASYTDISLYPTLTGLSIHGNIAAPIIDLNGAQNVTIDGRVDRTGTAKDLCIYNANTSSTEGTSTIRFINGASSNTVQYCLVKGSGVYPDEKEGGGIVLFSTSTSEAGNSNNTITNNSFTNYAGNRPTTVIFSKGTEGKENSGTTISNNVFYDHFNAGNASNGIDLYLCTTGYTITGNSFYETTTFAPTAAKMYRGITIGTKSGNFVVSGNTIGGNATGNTGTMTMDAAVGHYFVGVMLNVGTDVASSVQNNTITNMAITSSLTEPWLGMLVMGGNVNIGTATGNTIGSATGTGSITVTNTVADATSYGIYCRSTGTVNIQNNTIASVTTVGSTTKGHSFYGINHSASGVLNISNNTIGSTTESNSIDANSVNSSGSSGVVVCGIQVVNAGTTTITGNTIANMRNQATDNLGTSTTTGIIANDGTLTVTNNTVRNLYNACAGTGSSMSGISISRNGYASAANISGNTIYELSNTGASYAGSVTGLNISDIGTSTSSVVAKNLVRDLRVSSASSSAAIYGLTNGIGSATYSNNAISLGSGITNGNIIIGIKYSPSTGTTNMYFNSVNIEGTASGTTGSTYALSNGPSGIRIYKNNIFSNTRTGGTGGTHYAISLGSSNSLTIDYNDYYAPNGVLGKFNGSDKATLGEWQAVTLQDDHSKNRIVYFVSSADLNLTGASAGDASLMGIPISGISTDIVGTARSTEYPYMGAYENTTTPLPVELVSFTACVSNSGVAVNWQTAMEINSYGYEIERRASAAKEFVKVGFVEGKGTSNSPSAYAFNDRNSSGGKMVYRLKSIDKDGTFTYSNEVEVTVVPTVYALMQNYPNPFNPSTTVSFSLPVKTRVRLDVYNAVGQLVTTLVDEEREAGYYQAQWNASGMASGMYFYRIATEKFTSVKKMMLVK